jgi:hypothetical protein
MNSKTQLAIAIVAIVVTAVAMAWMLTHRRHRYGDQLAPVAAPTLLELSAQHEGQKRPSKDGDTLAAGDAIDFQVEVQDLCFVYVYSVQGDVAKLDWGSRADEAPWQKGVYAPNFNAGKSGVTFGTAGDAALYVVASPLPMPDAATWNQAALKDVASRCPKCGVASAKFHVVPKP